MTTAQRTGLRYAVAFIAASATVIFSAGMARTQLDGKEDRAQHDADVRALNSALLAEQTARTLQQVRDSALMAVVLERVTDLACQQNPARRYCR